MENVVDQNKKPKRVQTLMHLKEHLYNHKDAIVIIGPYIDKEPIINLDETLYSRKSLKRTQSDFWKYYKENVDKKIDDSNIYNLIRHLMNEGIIKTVVNQSITSSIPGENLKGNVYIYNCDKCKTIYSRESIVFDTEALNECELCKGAIRPSVLLNNEKYNQNMVDNIIDALNETHTVIMIGVDFMEPIVDNLIGKYGTLKEIHNDTEDGDNQKIAISIQEQDSFDPNEVLFCEFKVEGNIEGSLIRLIKGLN